MVFSVFLESLILTVCWYGTGRFINSKVTPHVRKSWGCEGFRTLRRESRFSSFMGPSLKEFLSRWWWWCCCWEGELRSSSACIFFSVSLWLIPAHASPLPLLLTQYIAALPYTYYKGYIPTSSQSLSCRCQWTPMAPCPQHKIIDNLVIVTKMSMALPISMFLLQWLR